MKKGVSDLMEGVRIMATILGGLGKDVVDALPKSAPVAVNRSVGGKVKTRRPIARRQIVQVQVNRLSGRDAGDGRDVVAFAAD